MRAAILGDVELARVLADKLEFDSEHVEAVVRQIARIAVIVRPGERLSAIVDEPDNRVLEYTVAGGAQFIVLHDRHLLSLHEYEGAWVVGVSEAAVALL
jgi:predicted nucleic acid-binding protein